jgi:hypothetical protein
VSTLRQLCLTVHAERLHEAPVWHAVQRLLGRLERAGGRATFLVSPLRASVAGVDLGPRLRELVRHGHEVGQHTHYYALATAAHGVSFEKRTDVSPENLRRCLDHDHGHLLAAGIRPRGFVAGAWAIHDVAQDWLVEHGFEYDLSFRSFPLGYDSPAAARGDGCDRPFVRRGLLEIPTTATLALAVRRALARHDLPYEVVYVHDYDLTAARSRLLLAALDRVAGPAERVTVGTLKARLAAGSAAA